MAYEFAREQTPGASIAPPSKVKKCRIAMSWMTNEKY